MTRRVAQYDLFLLLMDNGDGDRDALLSRLDAFREQTDDARAGLQARAIAHSIRHDRMGSFLSWSMMVYREMRGD